MRALILYKSIHLGNTRKVAERMAKVLHADIAEPEDVDPAWFDDYDIIGFGSGIYGMKHHQAIIDIAGRAHDLDGKTIFVFSTYAMWQNEYNKALNDALTGCNASIAGEFHCKGLNKNSFMKYFGGMNKGRPSEDDLVMAEEFAKGLLS